jgi:hypothetical protein
MAKRVLHQAMPVAEVAGANPDWQSPDYPNWDSIVYLLGIPTATRVRESLSQLAFVPEREPLHEIHHFTDLSDFRVRWGVRAASAIRARNRQAEKCSLPH